jgi:hypothetical protein
MGKRRVSKLSRPTKRRKISCQQNVSATYNITRKKKELMALIHLYISNPCIHSTGTNHSTRQLSRTTGHNFTTRLLVYMGTHESPAG